MTDQTHRQTTEDEPLAPRQLSRQTRWLVIVLAVAAAAVVLWPRGGGKNEAPGGSLFDARGRSVAVGSRMAPVTLVHFWATWCPPCMTEVPSITRLADDFAPYRGDFTVLMVSVADDPQRVETFVGDRIASVLYDPSWDVAHRYGTFKLPETYLVVRGDVVERWIGAQDWSDPSIRKRIQDAIQSLRGDQTTAAKPAPRPAEES